MSRPALKDFFSLNVIYMLTECPAANCAGSRLPGIFGLFVVRWESFSEVEDKSSKVIRSAEHRRDRSEQFEWSGIARRHFVLRVIFCLSEHEQTAAGGKFNLNHLNEATERTTTSL